jgi:UPF0716 protein FxsA
MGILIVLFIAVPIAEIYVIIKVGELIGILPTIGLLIADALLGSLLLRQQGRAAWRRFNAAIAEGRFPGREVADGLMVTVGGTLLLAPGFITDVAGLLLLIPPTRALLRSGLFRYLRRRFVLVGPSGAYGPPGGGYGEPAGGRRPHDFEGSAREVPGEDGFEENQGNGAERPRLPPS